MNEVVTTAAAPAWLLILNGCLVVALFSSFYWLAMSTRRVRALERQVRGIAVQLNTRMMGIEDELASAPAIIDTAVEEPAVRVFSELQSSERAKIMKFNRLGKSPEEIAPLVGMPAATVRLMLKVQAIEATAAVSDRKVKNNGNHPIQSRNSFDRE